MHITELKRHLDGRVERFDCRLVMRRSHLAVLRFDHEEERRAGGFTFPSGGRSFGFFWRRRPYLLYRMLHPEGGVIAHRFDVVEAMRIDEREVSYTDLLLDLWVGPSGELRLEDEDEVAAFAWRGLLSPSQRERIEHTRALLLRRHAAVIREADRILSAVAGP